MTGFRRLFLDHSALSAWVIALALLMKIAVPAGFMPVVADGRVMIAICSGVQPAEAPMTMHGPMAGMTHHRDMAKSGHRGADHSGEHSGKEMPCAFAGLAMPSLAATDAPMLALAIAFIVATVFRAVARGIVRAPPFLRPPLRGPPSPA